jgi:tetratricopeptide (TPR) repeat protein
VSYKTPEGAGLTASPSASPYPTVTGFSVPVRSPIHFSTSPFAPAPAGFIPAAQLDGRNFPSSPFPTLSPFISTPRLEAANFQGVGSATSPAASTPGLVADTGFEGASPAPWNDAAHEAICAIEGSGLTADGPPDTGFVYLEQKSYALERELYALERLHGKNSPEALRLMAELVQVLKDKGRYKSAGMFGRRRVLAHRDRGEKEKEAWALQALADIFRLQGDLKKAAMTATKSYDMARTGSSRNERLAFEAQRLLGFIFAEDQQPERAEEILIGLLGQVDHVLGINNRHVQASIMMNLTFSALQRGKLRQAEERAVKAVELCNQLNPESDLSCCHAPVVLAGVWIRQARYDEALKIGLQCIAACKKRCGLEHPTTANCMLALGRAYTGQGQWNQAESCIKAAIDVRRRILGPGHFQMADALIDRLYLYVEQQLWDQAEAVLAEYRSTGVSCRYVSVFESAIIDARGRHSQALKIGQAPTQKLEATNDPKASYANNVIVKILRNLGMLEESEGLASRNIDCSTSLLGPKHPWTLQSVDNVARAKMAKGEATRAIQIMEECVQSLTTSVGSEHYLTRRSRETLDQWMEMGGQYSVLPEVTSMEPEVWLAL